MIGQFLLPLLSPIFAALSQMANRYGVTPLGFRVVKITCFLFAVTAMALHLPIVGLVLFLLHFAVGTIEGTGKETEAAHLSQVIPRTLHVFSFSGLALLALMFGTAGIADNFGTPLSFLFFSWIILSLVLCLKPDGFHIVGWFEVASSVVIAAIWPTYIPAIAILFGLTCLVSAGICFLKDK